MRAVIGIVIPALNESQHLPHLARDLEQLSVDYSVVVADAGSSDDTRETARGLGWTVVGSERGRAVQMNAGARCLDTSWYLFIHADTRIPPAAVLALERTLELEHVSAAVWRLGIDSPGLWFRIVEFGALLRNLLLGLAYGDQGLLVSRELYDLTGGFPEIPIMEDVAMVRELRKRTRLRTMPARILVSPRRWQREGPYRTWLRNIVLITLYLAGVSPEKLARWYPAERG